MGCSRPVEPETQLALSFSRPSQPVAIVFPVSLFFLLPRFPWNSRVHFCGLCDIPSERCEGGVYVRECVQECQPTIGEGGGVMVVMRSKNITTETDEVSVAAKRRHSQAENFGVSIRKQKAWDVVGKFWKRCGKYKLWVSAQYEYLDCLTFSNFKFEDRVFYEVISRLQNSKLICFRKGYIPSQNVSKISRSHSFPPHVPFCNSSISRLRGRIIFRKVWTNSPSIDCVSEFHCGGWRVDAKH